MLCTEDGYLFLSSWRQISIPFITLSVSSCSPAAPANPFVRKEVILRHWLMQQLRRGQIVSLWEIRNSQIFVGSRLCTVCCCQHFALVHPAERAIISDTLWSYQSNILSKIFQKTYNNLNGVIRSFSGLLHLKVHNMHFQTERHSGWVACLMHLILGPFSGWPEHTGSWSYRL